MRAGRKVKQATGYEAFVPAPLPPDPPINMEGLTAILSHADRSLGRLDGVASVLPNPDLFVAMYVRQEAVLSSQIEGTLSTLDDVLQFEIDAAGHGRPKDVGDVVNYVNAMNHGLARLRDFPLSLRLIREMHQKLLENVRGRNRTPGEFRRSQNWIGPENSTLANATFVPPPVPEMHQALDNLEKFFHNPQDLPVLIQCGLAHAQFETIHPFLDGNGRVGRLLITFLLCQREVLHRPLLYLSHFLKLHRTEYYDRLMAVRNDGDWEGWLRFFLKGVHEVSGSATDTAREILRLRDQHRRLIMEEQGSVAGYEVRLLDLLFEKPIVTGRIVEQRLGCSYVTSLKLIRNFEHLGLLHETTGYQRNRRFRYEPYLALFEPSRSEPIEAQTEPAEIQTTGSQETS